MTTIHLIAAARPNFMKIAPLYHALKREEWCVVRLIHTGQHYDANMSDSFFRDLRLPEPDFHLGVGSGTHAEQTGRVMIEYEKVCLEKERPDWTIVVGDVNATVSCALVCAKLGIQLAHLEAGLRSGDRTMPEEINRIVTDSIADVLWTPSPDGDENLLHDGVPSDKITRVGNIMMDSFEMLRPSIEASGCVERLGLTTGEFGLITFHRPANVDTEDALSPIVDALEGVTQAVPLIFPVHPRTRSRLIEFGLMSRLESNPSITLTDPLGYIEFMSLVMNSRLVITDSGGIQEETTYLGIPCLTMRPNTERPITISEGTNQLVTANELADTATALLEVRDNNPVSLEFWDGQTASRIVQDLFART